MIKSAVFLTAIVTLTLGGLPQTASADQIPGLRGHDHTGITVPDVKAATAFFTDVIGCTHAMSFGPFRMTRERSCRTSSTSTRVP
jgi:hypothetical protein